MSDFGYCLAHRKAWTHPIFKDLREAAIWNFLYQNAFWEDGIRNFNGHVFELKRGQIVVTNRFLAKGFGMTEKGARLVIQKLEKHKMLATKGTNKGTIITICNYNKFQSFEKTKGKQEGNPRANEGQTKGANNNKVNKDKEVKEIIIPDFINGDLWIEWINHRSEIKKKLTPTQSQKQISKLTKWHNEGIDVNQVILDSISNGWQGLFKPKKGAKNGKSKIDYIAEGHAKVMDKYRDRGA